jgi:hypothetical protein
MNEHEFRDWIGRRYQELGEIVNALPDGAVPDAMIALMDKMADPDAHPDGPLSDFRRRVRVEKKSGSRWTGEIVGAYSTALTPVGWCVESETETGSVQIYPEKALRLAPKEDQ